jgi:putative membrane protein
MKKYEQKINVIIEWLIYMICYTVILIGISMFFKNTIQIDNTHYGAWVFFASIIIYLLNQTIKPIIIKLTIPIMALTFGILYPFVNLLILKLVDWILGSHFTINGIFYAYIVAVIISILNSLMTHLIIKPVIRKEK